VPRRRTPLVSCDPYRLRRPTIEALGVECHDDAVQNLEPSDYKHVVLGLIFLVPASRSALGEQCGVFRLSAGRDGAEGKLVMDGP
jgi:hypothetical protein